MKIRNQRWVRRDKPADDTTATGAGGGTLPESEDLLAAGAEASLEGEAGGAEGPAEGQNGAAAPTTGAEGAEAPEEQELFIGEAEAPNDVKAAPGWLKRLRLRVKEQADQLAQLGAGRTSTATPAKPVVGPKPTIEQFAYDADKYAAALDKWHDDRGKAERIEQQARDQQTQEERAWQTKVSGHEAKGKALPFKDYDDCTAAAEAELSPVQRAIIVKGASNSALVMYALGRNIQKAEELAAITDPIEFAFAVADFQKGLSMKTRTPKTKPEPTVSSGAPASAVLSTEDKKLEELRADAIKSGDMSKLMAHKRRMADAAAKRKT